MTTTHAAALALIEERLALVEAGTAGEWFHFYPGQCCRDDCVTPNSTSGGIHNAQVTNADAALIVAAVNDYAPLLMLARDVLVRHAQITADRRKSTYAPKCTHCQRAWPCPDARAALRSVGLVTE